MERELTTAQQVHALLSSIKDEDDESVFTIDDITILVRAIRPPLLALFPEQAFLVDAQLSSVLKGANQSNKVATEDLFGGYFEGGRTSEIYLIDHLLNWAHMQIENLQRLQSRLDAEVDRLRTERMLLDDRNMAKVTRYESHHRRQFIQSCTNSKRPKLGDVVRARPSRAWT